jgi:hypothetical protein
VCDDIDPSQHLRLDVAASDHVTPSVCSQHRLSVVS